MLASGFYAIWDSQQIMQEADSVTYKTYKPSENPKTFEETPKDSSQYASVMFRTV